MITKPTNTVIGQNIELSNLTSLVSLRTSGQVVGQSKAIVFNSSITLDLSTSNNFYIVQTGAINFNAPINATPGQSGSITLVQDDVGGRTITFNASVWKFIGGVMPTPAQVANSVNVVFYYVDSLSRIITQMVPSGINVFTGANYTYNTPGTYSLVVPAGASTLIFSGRGGGGGGGGGSGWWAGNFNYQQRSGGGGGSSGEYNSVTIPVNANDVIEIIIGSGGAGGAGAPSMTYGANGANGTQTNIKRNNVSQLSLLGGLGGLGGPGGAVIWTHVYGVDEYGNNVLISSTWSLLPGGEGGASVGTGSYAGGSGGIYHSGPSGGGPDRYAQSGAGPNSGTAISTGFNGGGGGGGDGLTIGGNGDSDAFDISVGVAGGGGGGGFASDYRAGARGGDGYATVQLLP